MKTELLPALMAFAFIGSITPGGSTLFSSSTGSRFGIRRSIPLLSGLVVGFTLLTALCAVGVGALLHSVGAIRVAVKVAGTAYLLWLAYHIGMSGAPSVDTSTVNAPPAFRTGVIFNLLNPKAWTVVISATAAYASLTDSTALLATVLVVVFSACCTIACIAWCAGGHALSRALTSDRQWRTVNAILGLLLALTVIPMWLE